MTTPTLTTLTITPSHTLTLKAVWIVLPTHSAAPEHHVILCECPSLIGHQILNLAEVLSDIECPTLDGCVPARVVQVEIKVDKEDLSNFHYLDGNIQRDWNCDLEEQ